MPGTVSADGTAQHGQHEQTADSAEKRGRRRKRQRASRADAEVDRSAAGRAEDEQQQQAEERAESAAAVGARRRYIVFVGNLPYRASVGDVQRLFGAMKPVGCRLPTDKNNRKPKGYAFVEFDDAACMTVHSSHPSYRSQHRRTH